MSMPNLTGASYKLEFMRGAVASPSSISAAIDLSRVGFTLRDPYALQNKYKAVKSGVSHGETPIGGGYLDSGTIVATSTLYDENAYSLWNAHLKGIQTQLMESVLPGAANTFNYLRIQLWDGSAFQSYRIYVEFDSMEVPLLEKTQWKAATASIMFRRVDPFLYSDTTTTKSDTASGGNAQVVIAQVSTIEHRRIYYKITRTSADVTDPTVTDSVSGHSFTITGTLNDSNEYWVVDTYQGRLFEGTGTFATATDIPGSFSGKFMPRYGTAMIVSCAATGTVYDFDIVYLDLPY